MENTRILEKVMFPSPSPKVYMYLVTYLSAGLRVKGLLAEPVQEGVYEGMLYLRGGELKTLAW